MRSIFSPLKGLSTQKCISGRTQHSWTPLPVSRINVWYLWSPYLDGVSHLRGLSSKQVSTRQLRSLLYQTSKRSVYQICITRYLSQRRAIIICRAKYWRKYWECSIKNVNCTGWPSVLTFAGWRHFASTKLTNTHLTAVLRTRRGVEVCCHNKYSLIM